MAAATAPIVVAAGPITVTLDATDAIAVGQQLRAQARDPKTPLGVRPLLARVGQQLCSAAIAQAGK